MINQDPKDSMIVKLQSEIQELKSQIAEINDRKPVKGQIVSASPVCPYITAFYNFF